MFLQDEFIDCKACHMGLQGCMMVDAPGVNFGMTPAW
jgi:hypothetical protein